MCAEEVVTERPLPAFDQAAIDGYAVRSVDVLGVGELGTEESGDEPGEALADEDGRDGLVLPVMGTIEAGARTPSRLQPRQAVRVQTGAPLPTLADAVLPLRWTDGGTSRVRILRGAPSGAYVRRAGDDVQPGDVAVRAGTIIGAAQVGLLAAVGRERVLVHPRPRLSVMAVGGELVDISRTPGNGQVYDVNSYALAAAARDAGAEVNRIGIVPSNPQEFGEIVQGQINRAEVVVIAGGVGGAAAEAIRGVLSGLGEMEVVRVGMHPGSVQGFGQLGRDGVPTFLLPANPVSALVVFEVMVRPLIRLSLGKRQPMRRVVQARTLSPISSVAGRKGFLRGQLMRDQDTGEYLVQALGGAPGASSHLLATLAEANCLVVVPRDAEQIRTGEVVEVAFLAQRGGEAWWHLLVNLWHTSSQHPGWPTSVGPLRVAAGLIRLRPVRLRDAAKWSRARMADRKHLEPWEPSTEADWTARHSVSAWPAVCSSLRAEARNGRMLPYVIELNGEFCGQLTVGNVAHGALRSAWIGYWVSSSVTGGGVATGALALGLDHCFGPVRLHRVEATVRPENAASRAVLAKVGFREEGLLKRYLQVDGGWRDHLLVGLTIEEVYGSVVSALVREGHAHWA